MSNKLNGRWCPNLRAQSQFASLVICWLVAVIVFGQKTQTARGDIKAEVRPSFGTESVLKFHSDAYAGKRLELSQVIELCFRQALAYRNVDDEWNMVRVESQFFQTSKMVSSGTEVLKGKRQGFHPRFISEVTCFSASPIEQFYFYTRGFTVRQGLSWTTMRFGRDSCSLAVDESFRLRFNGSQSSIGSTNTSEPDKGQYARKCQRKIISPTRGYGHSGQFSDNYGFSVVILGFIVTFILVWFGFDRIHRGLRQSGCLFFFFGVSCDILATGGVIVGCLLRDWWRCLHNR